MIGPINEQEMLRILNRLDPNLAATDTAEDTASGTKDGAARVEQGKVIIVDPSNGGRKPTIQAQPPVRLRVNGKLVDQAVEVTSKHLIEWEIESQPLYKITVSEDKLTAYLQVHRTKRNAWLLTDQPTSLHLSLTAEEDTALILERVNLPDLMTAVDKMNIKMNLNIGAVQAEIVQPSDRLVQIAKGKPPVQGTDAQLEMFFSEHVESTFMEVDGVVDYKNHLQIPSVKKGEVIARKIPSLEGHSGYDVFGNVLLPDPVRDIRIAGKDSVVITPDNEVVALKEGRPRVTGQQIKFFDINQAFIIPGNVDLQTGNIVFAGDVVVYGDVTDHMIIESLGNIYVAGSVFNATLTATGSIAVQGNVLGSNLYSGYFGMLYNRLYHGAKRLLEICENVTKSADLLLQEVRRRNMEVRYGQALLLITENKHQKAGEIIRELLTVISSIQSHDKEKLQQLRSYLEILLRPLQIIETMTASKMEDFKRNLRDVLLRVAVSQESHVRINVNQAHNSNLKSNGDILIRREGVIQCDLYSAGNIVFFLDNAVCRGSRLEAGDTISAMQVGGVTGVATVLKAMKKIMVKKMYEGRIIIDRYSAEIVEPVEEATIDCNNIRQWA